MRVALSNSATGVFTNDGDLYEILRNAGTLSGDRVWRFPLWQHFTDEVTSKRLFNITSITYHTLFYMKYCITLKSYRFFINFATLLSVTCLKLLKLSFYCKKKFFRKS